MTIAMSVITLLYDDNDVDNFYTKKKEYLPLEYYALIN